MKKKKDTKKKPRGTESRYGEKKKSERKRINFKKK